jgi:hypothetical protein
MINKIGLVFDQKLIDEIANSSAQDDWKSFGWRGIYFLRERVIIDYDGKLYWCSYKTKDRIELEDKLLTKDRNNLYEPLKNFKSNIGSYVSKTYNIRLDKMDDNSIRCIFWNKQQTQSEEPVFILLNGKEHVEGSIGDTYIIFKNNSKIYILYVGNAWQIERYDIGIYVDQNYEFIESYFLSSKYCLFSENMDMVFME